MAWSKLIGEKTGLVIDAYFSGTKIKHLLDTIPGLRCRAERGEILFGTVDSFLIWRLTGGQRHVTDVTNASRTMLFNLHTLDWDDELLKLLDIPRAMLPEVHSNSEIYARNRRRNSSAGPFAIAGCAGDQQAATFGQACFEIGSAKNTYGTGCFMLLNVGPKPVTSKNKLLATVGWQIGGETTYCLEGSVFIAGAVVQWLRDQLQVIESSAEVEVAGRWRARFRRRRVCARICRSGRPALGSIRPRGDFRTHARHHRRPHCAGSTGIDGVSNQRRAGGDAETTPAFELSQLKVDGGASVNNPLMQFQADLLGVPVVRPFVAETTALGVAYLAGLAVGFWNDTGRCQPAIGHSTGVHEPNMRRPIRRSSLLNNWK